MYCVIQEVERKKPSPYGCHEDIEVYCYETNGMIKYAYRHAGGRFERPIKTAYKVSIHSSKRVHGVVTKQQFVITTAGYYDLAEYWIGDCFITSKLDTIAASLNTSADVLWALINGKVDPLEAQIKAEFANSKEGKAIARHKAIIARYQAKKATFAKKYGVSQETYDTCYDVFGTLRNPKYLDTIIAAKAQQHESYSGYRKTAGSTYGGYDYADLFSSQKGAYSAEDKRHLKQFYRTLAKAYHPDLHPENDTHAAMVLLNRLKEEWGL